VARRRARNRVPAKAIEPGEPGASADPDHTVVGHRGVDCRSYRPHGLGARDIVANINFFMYVPVACHPVDCPRVLADKSNRREE